jgi:hypothetical protein
VLDRKLTLSVHIVDGTYPRCGDRSKSRSLVDTINPERNDHC